nr:MAG TPA: hypothetical protein [Caudoviricetes sp.]
MIILTAFYPLYVRKGQTKVKFFRKNFLKPRLPKIFVSPEFMRVSACRNFVAHRNL